MLPPNKKEMESLDISFVLSDRDRAVLTSAVQCEWFDLLQKIMEEEIRLLTVKLVNTPSDDEKQVIANFRVLKGASMFYKGIIDRLNEELQLEKYQAAKTGTIENPEILPSIDLGGE